MLKMSLKVVFFSPSKCYFNSPEIYTTREYKIVREVTQPEQFNSYGIINHDGIKNIKVFPSVDYSSCRVGNHTLIRLQLPPKDGLKKGESTEIRIKFQVSSFFNKVTTGLFPVYSIELSYFPTLHIDEKIDQPDEKFEIKSKPVLGLAENHFKGGLDIFLYLPPGFEDVTGFNSFKEKFDVYNIDGEKTSQKRTKFLWRLREFLKDRNLPEDSLLGTGLNVFMSGTFTKKYDAEEVIDTMSKRIPPGFWTRRIDKSILFGYIAIALAVIAMLTSLFLFFLNR